MKFNLKNRPKIEKWEKQSQDYPEVINTSIKIPSTDDYEKWFEGFGKELQEKLAKCADQRHTSPNNSAYLLLGMESIIRQILGDEVKTETKP